MRRIQVSLNKDMGRLRRVVLSDQPDDAPCSPCTVQRQPDLMLADRPRQMAARQREIRGPTPPHHRPPGQRDHDLPRRRRRQGMRADLERLLKYAWTG
jgi:hypothetical protein